MPLAALEPDLTTRSAGDPRHQGQPEADAAVLAGVRLVQLLERLEETRTLPVIDPKSRIRDLEYGDREATLAR